MKSFFIAGTDTGIGKTTLAVALLDYFASHHKRAVGLKPLASGGIKTTAGWRNEDGLMLQAASTVKLPYETINPVLLQAPLAPSIAADYENRRFAVSDLLQACEPGLNSEADYCVVESAGGWLVPLNEKKESLADFAKALNFPVILVVGMRLGCLNHALLTVESIKQQGLLLKGWIANGCDPVMQAFAENQAILEDRILAPLLGIKPYQK